MAIYSFRGRVPSTHETCFVAAEATLIGSVHLARASSVWPGAILRADNEPIHVEEGANIQDGAIIHTDPGYQVEVGKMVSVGHGAVLHGCRIGQGSLIGIGAVILNGAVIGDECLVGAGALVTEGKQFPARSLIVGVPAKRLRELNDDEVRVLQENNEDYQARAAHYMAELQVVDGARRATP